MPLTYSDRRNERNREKRVSKHGMAKSDNRRANSVILRALRFLFCFRALRLGVLFSLGASKLRGEYLKAR